MRHHPIFTDLTNPVRQSHPADFPGMDPMKRPVPIETSSIATER